MIELVKQLIEQDGLDKKNRRSDLVNKRKYLYYCLRKQGMSLWNIADLFAQHYSTIIHGIRSYNNLIKVGDKNLQYDTEYYRLVLDLNKPEVDLRKEITQATNLVDLRKIQNRILNNIY